MQRESELNWRTALLENELRSSRLKQQNTTPAAEPASPETARRPTLAERWRPPPRTRMRHRSTTTNRNRQREI